MMTQLHTGFTQQYRLSVNGGGNASFLTGFQNSIMTARRTALFDPELGGENGNSIAGRSSHASTKPGVGFYVDGTVDRCLKNNWTVSVSLGLNQVAFSYDMDPDKSWDNSPMMQQALPVISDLRLLYLHSRLLNVTKQWGRFEAQAGPVLSYLVHKKYTRSVSFYENGGSVPAVITIGDNKGEARKFLAGADLAVRYRILRNLGIDLRAQRYFTPVYQKEQTGEDRYKKGRPLQLSLGLNYRLAGF